MPPRRSARGAAAAAAAAAAPPAPAAPSPSPSPPPKAKSPYPLRGCRIAVSGALPGLTHEDVLDKAKALGAVVTQNVTQTVTHLITTEQEVADQTPKVRAVKKHGRAKMVSMDWLEKCEDEGDRVPEDEYELKPPAAVKAEPASSSSAAQTPAANGIKRAASPAPIPAPAKKRTKKNGELLAICGN